ncbi:hypothetical protein JHK85_048396 [Glycine max]|nr:hypothetical protein JHK86_047778 [Glycine max]KAG4943750.1 hypothetical protein JHK85_048396 [Glycine max]
MSKDANDDRTNVDLEGHPSGDALDDDEDLDSRTNAFAKRKATVPLTSSTLRDKKQKGHSLMSYFLL